MMGSGKSIIGSKFAKLINFNFIDTDKLIEEKLKNQLIKYLMNLEKRISESLKKNISKILFKKNYVISLGGGVMNNKIKKILKKTHLTYIFDVSNNIFIKKIRKF